MMIRKQQKGFTLIELMIVVAIIGILASVAIPMYGDYVTRSKISAIMASVGNVKTAITLHRQEGNMTNAVLTVTRTAPTGTGDWQSINMRSAPAVPNDVVSITVTAGTSSAVPTIELLLDDKFSGETGKKIILTPTFAGNAKWRATYDGTAGVISKYLQEKINGS